MVTPPVAEGAAVVEAVVLTTKLWASDKSAIASRSPILEAGFFLDGATAAAGRSRLLPVLRRRGLRRGFAERCR